MKYIKHFKEKDNPVHCQNDLLNNSERCATIYIYIYKITDVKFIKNIPHLIFNFPNYKVLAMTFFQSRNFHKTYKTTKLCIIFNTFNNRSNYFINKAGLQIFSSKYRLKVVL